MFKGFFHFVRINLVNDLHSCGGLIYSFLVIWSSSNLLLGDCFSNRFHLQIGFKPVNTPTSYYVPW
uniref:Uncharacterized protein n=1 Tax=Helianthus annuus TaxID=4232 RepID=A0A251UER4_HELAN